MDTRGVSSLGTFPNAAAAAWRQRRSDPPLQSNLDRLTNPKLWSDSSEGRSSDYRIRSRTAASFRGLNDVQSNKLHQTPAQAREYNELQVSLSFEDRQGFNGSALLDTGAKDNWISDSLSKRLLLPRQSFPEEVFASFEGKRVKCSESVHGFWHHGYQTFPVTFKVCNELPVDVLFGLDLLRRVGLINFEDANRENLNKVLVLAKLKAKKEEQQQDAAHQEEQKLKAEKAERWHAMNNDKDWTWDNNERRFWKKTGTGAIIWSSERW